MTKQYGEAADQWRKYGNNGGERQCNQSTTVLISCEDGMVGSFEDDSRGECSCSVLMSNA